MKIVKGKKGAFRENHLQKLLDWQRGLPSSFVSLVQCLFIFALLRTPPRREALRHSSGESPPARRRRGGLTSDCRKATGGSRRREEAGVRGPAGRPELRQNWGGNMMHGQDGGSVKRGWSSGQFAVVVGPMSRADSLVLGGDAPC